MVVRMRTTLNIEQALLKQLRVEAARRGTTMSALVEAGLRHVLPAPDPGDGKAKKLPPLPVWRSGGYRVDIANRDELYRLMDGY